MAAAAQTVSQSPVVPKSHTVAHPFCPLSADEIRAASALVRSIWPTSADLRFKTVTLDEPAKKEFLPYLDAEHSGAPLPHIERRAFVAYYIRNTVLMLPLGIHQIS